MPKAVRHILFVMLTIGLPFPGKLSAQYKIVESMQALNAAYLELGGNSDTYSVNYERLLFQRAAFKTGLRIGVGSNLFFLPEEDNTYPIIPLEAIGLIGHRNRHFEFGLGYTRRLTDNPDLLQEMYFGRLGFRYHPPEGGLLVRVALTPFVSSETNVRTPGLALVPRFGLSVGRSF
ncbi:hypothetical protein [uncultured Pontibacter sp.]|uniref:hypothetical protein n=1 Tax=uncultured Pontibacter sp. TaxID=453356 RepID=UPI0026174239|nr:hypothetical protein [uncultured Pontibacter sp.]